MMIAARSEAISLTDLSITDHSVLREGRPNKEHRAGGAFVRRFPDLPPWALRPSASDLQKRHRPTRAPCSVQERPYGHDLSKTTTRASEKNAKSGVLDLTKRNRSLVPGSIVSSTNFGRHRRRT